MMWDKEAEAGLLASVLRHPAAAAALWDRLSAGLFTDPPAVCVQDAVYALCARGDVPTLATVSAEVRTRGDVPPDFTGYMAMLGGREAAESDAHTLLPVLEAYKVARDAVAAAQSVAAAVPLGPGAVAGAAADAAARLQDLAAPPPATEPVRPVDLSMDVVLDVEARMRAPGGVTGVRTHIGPLDSMLCGLQPGELTIVGARPSMGKTAFALTVARNVAGGGVPVLFFSLEMGARQLVTRLAISESGLDGTRVRRGDISPAELSDFMVAVGRVERLDIYIDDAPSQTIGAIQSKSRRFVRDKGVGLIVLDYLQLARGPEQGRNGTREQEVSALSRGLKLLAKECGVPVVALSQLSRVSERRNDKRPTLSDLRESGAIEQDADNVLMLHRPEYYGVVQDEAGESLEGVCDVIVGKQRNGPVGEVRLAFDSRRGLFTAPQPSGHAFHGHNPIAPF